MEESAEHFGDDPLQFLGGNRGSGVPARLSRTFGETKRKASARMVRALDILNMHIVLEQPGRGLR
jgi:hypothetical protein